jgi:hypothetical protein
MTRYLHLPMKRGILPTMFLLLMPFVLGGALAQGVEFFLGQGSNTQVLKIGLFIITFAVLKGTMDKMKLFPEHPNTHPMIAIVLSIIAIKFMPIEFVSGLGTLIWIAALFLLPYVLVGLIVKNGKVKAVLTLILAGGMYYFISGGMGLYGSRYPYLGYIRGSEIFDDIYYHSTTIPWLTPFLIVVAFVILIFILVKYKGEKGVKETKTPGDKGPGWLRRKLINRKAQKAIDKEAKAKQQEADKQREHDERIQRMKHEAELAKIEAMREKAEEEKGRLQRAKEAAGRAAIGANEAVKKGLGKAADGAYAGAKVVGDGLMKAGKPINEAVKKGAGKAADAAYSGAQGVGRGLAAVPGLFSRLFRRKQKEEQQDQHVKDYEEQKKKEAQTARRGIFRRIFGKKEEPQDQHVKDYEEQQRKAEREKQWKEYNEKENKQAEELKRKKVPPTPPKARGKVNVKNKEEMIKRVQKQKPKK